MNLYEYLNRVVLLVMLLALTACATPATPAAPSPTAASVPTPTPPTTPSTPNSKLSARLQQLAASPALQSASAAEQARALSLPESGPGSLVRDEQRRILVTMRTSDVTDAFQKALRDMGANIQNVSDRYQSITIFVPLNQLNAVAALPAVQNVQEELAPSPGSG